MNIGILRCSWRDVAEGERAPCLAEQLLMQAIEARGHTATLFFADRCEFLMGSGGLELYYEGKAFPQFDVVIPRSNVTISYHAHLTLMHHLMLAGIPVLNDYFPVLAAKNKIQSLQTLAAAGVPVPKTRILQTSESLGRTVEQLGGYPVVMKTSEGSYGLGVIILESERAAKSTLDMVRSQSHWRTLILQEFIKEAQDKDVRVFVVGDRVVAAMERTSQSGDFRSNIHAGGVGTLTSLTLDEERMAIQATELLGLEMAGVDLLRTSKGPMVMEVNANPGLEGVTKITGVDVAGAVVEFAIQKAHRHQIESGGRKQALS